MRFIITVLFCFLLHDYPDFNGVYCSESPGFTLGFEKPNKIKVFEMDKSLQFGRTGFGTYEFCDSIIYIEYLHHRKDSIFKLKTDYKSDSLTIFVRDCEDKTPLPGAEVNYVKNKICKLTYIDGKTRVPNLNDEIHIKFLHWNITFQNNPEERISSYEVFCDYNLYIDKSRDTLKIKSINDSMIIFKNGYTLKKDYCRKKTFLY